jgi:transcriptional regulator with XRE-family HTH domain
VATDQDIAMWLRRQLDRNEWSAADLARHSGIQPGRISEWLTRKRMPSSASCIRLADVFGADPDYVLALAGHRPASPQARTQDPWREVKALMDRVNPTVDRIAGLEATLRKWLELDRSTPSDSASNGR